MGEIKIEDKELDKEIDEMGEEGIMIYGEIGRDLDEDKKSIFKLNPKMATYEKLKIKGIINYVEEAFAKIR